MRALALILMTAAMAGCLGGGDEDGARDPGAWPGGPGGTEAAAWTTLLCTDGYRPASKVAQAVDRCNHRVTKPLLDNTSFDWRTQHGPANEVSVAVDPTDPLRVIGGAKDYTVSYISDEAGCGEHNVWMGAFWSTDGGLTWGNDLMPGFPGDERESPLRGNQCNTDPVMAFDDDGTAWFHALNYVGAREDPGSPLGAVVPSELFTGSQLYFARSDDGGASYGDITFAAVGDRTNTFNDKNWMAVQHGGDHMIATWSMFAPDGPNIYYTESFDAGATWGPMTPVPIGEARTFLSVQFSMPHYLPTDEAADLAMIWADFSGSSVRGGLGVQGTAQVAYTEGVTAGGGTVFQPPRSVCTMDPLKSGSGRDGTGNTTFRLSTYPVLAVDTSGGAHDGRRYVVWADQPGPLDSDTQIKLCHSDDGLTWTEGATVNQVEAGDQFMPWIDVDPDGGVHVAWYDKRDDPAGVLMDVYHAYSDDGGATWREQRVSETSFDGDLGHHQSGSTFIGDYIGLDTTSVSAHVFWADTRHTGEPGRLAGSDVYSATILKDGSSRAVFDAALGG